MLGYPRNQALSESLTVLLLTKNEAGNIGPLISSLQTHLSAAGPAFLVIDASQDNTKGEALAAGAEVVEDCSPYGVALLRGLRASVSDWVMVLDADGSHRAEDAVKLWLARDQADLVVGSRFVAGGSSKAGGLRLWLSRRLAGLFSAWAKLPARDVSSGFRLYRRAMFLDAPAVAKYFNVQPELLAHAALRKARVLEVGITYARRGQGSSKAHLFRYGFAFLCSLWRIRRRLRAARKA